MEGTGPVLICVFRFSKWIALLAAVFLLSANLDNVPDCPELLNSSSKSSVSVPFAHVPFTASLPEATSAKESFGPLANDTLLATESAAQVSPSRITRLLQQAADPSPPAV